MKRPKTIWFLIVLTLWSFGKNLQSLLFYGNSPNYLILSELDRAFFHFLVLAVVLILDAAFLFFLFRPRWIGFWVGVTDLLIGIPVLGWATHLLVGNPDIAKQAIIRNREQRGLPISLEKAEAVVSPQFAYATLAVMVALLFICLALLIWKRRYFLDSQGT